MLRARFVCSGGDERPVLWPIKHPYWCTGYDANDKPYVVAYVDNEDQLMAQWPDAENITGEFVEGYVFNDRFPVPDWFTPTPRAGGTDA